MLGYSLAVIISGYRSVVLGTDFRSCQAFCVISDVFRRFCRVAWPHSRGVPAGIYSGVLADGSGAFWLKLDELEEGCDRTAYLYVASEDGVFTAECTAEEAGGALLLTTEDGDVYAFDSAAATLVAAD